MGFSNEFAGMIRDRFVGDVEVLRVLSEGDRPKMASLLLKRMALSPEAILSHLSADAQEDLEERCEAAKPIAALLERLLEYEMTHGFSVMTKRQAATMSEEDHCTSLDAPL